MKGGIVEAMTEKNSSVSVMGTRRIVIWFSISFLWGPYFLLGAFKTSVNTCASCAGPEF